MTAHTSPRGQMTALFTTAVWGEAYIDRFLEYSLPTQLSSGNLGAFDHQSLFLIVTDAGDVDRVVTAPAYRELGNLVSTECVAREEISGSNIGTKYAKLTSCQNYALQRSIDFDMLFFGYGDALWADGSYRAAADRLHKGCDAVFGFGFPVESKAFCAATQAMATPGSSSIAIPPRTFAHYVHDYLHPMAHANKWGGGAASRCPSYVIWDVPGQGLLLRAFHLHPIAIRVRRDFPEFFRPFRSTLDEEFVARLYRTYPNVHVCGDSDEIGVCSLAETTGESYAGRARSRWSSGLIHEFAEAHAGLLHRELFSHAIRLKIADAREEAWAPAERQAAALAAEVAQRLQTPDCVLALEAPSAYRARWRRQAMFGHMSPRATKLQRTIMWRQQPHVQATRNIARESGRRVLEVLHALQVTRLIRLLVLPLLNERQRRWCYEFISRLGVDVPSLMSTQASAPTSFSWSRVWQWLRSLVGAHA